MKNSASSRLVTLCCFFLLYFGSIAAEDNENEDNSIRDRTVFQTDSGPITGNVIKTDNGKEVNVFLGIPYAEPPVGDLRFKPPKKIKPWKSVLQATKPMPICFQQLGEINKIVNLMRAFLQRPWSEDCLHLNIWSPNPKPDKAPVVFFIHGGAFIMGSSLGLVDGTTLASEGTVVVSVNYRLGVFGFFNLGIPEAPGNMGLMDQNVALTWVKENIESFGGDPEAITLMGASAGSASVGYHLLSPKSSGLFQKAIMMSGSPTNIWAIKEPERNREKSKSVVQQLGCQSPDTLTSFQCLQGRHPEDILEAASADGLLLSDFLPTIDGQFIIEHPSVSLESSRFNPANVLIGTAEDEGTLFLLTSNPEFFRTSDGRLLRRDFASVLGGSKPKLSVLQQKALDIAYTDWSNQNDPITLRNAAKDAYGDSLFNCHVNEFADKLSETEATVYRYVYGYKHSMASIFLPIWSGAVHGVDIFPVLGPVQFSKKFPDSPQDKAAKDRFLKHILNFVSKGDPNIKESGYPREPEWPTYDSKRNYLHFSANSTVLSNFRVRECATWLNLLPILEDKKC